MLQNQETIIQENIVHNFLTLKHLKLMEKVKWISVDDRLPEVGQEVIVATKFTDSMLKAYRAKLHEASHRNGEVRFELMPSGVLSDLYLAPWWTNDTDIPLEKLVFPEDILYCDFGVALKALKKGEKVSRKGWNGKRMFLFLFDSSFASFPSAGLLDGSKVVPSICMKTAQDTIVIGWLASQTDMLAEDWRIL